MMKVSNLNKTYDRRSRSANHVLRDVSFTLPETGFVCILGPSGCGKTSLLNAIGGLDRFDDGRITVGDVTVSSYGTAAFEAERNRSFGYIFQNYYLLQNHSAAYNVYLGLHSLDLSHTEKLRRVKEALAAVDMDRFLRRRVDALSGGQQQRVAIARALARRPRVIFADEPTGNLDEANTVNICSLLRKISRTSLVVMVTHEERIAAFFADRIIRLDNGRIQSDSREWDRSSLSLEGGNRLYAGEFAEEKAQSDTVSLRILREEGAEPVQLTVAVLKDRIVIKLDDGRTISCNSSGESPEILEGRRPAMTLETLEQADFTEFSGGPGGQTRAGQGLGFGMMLAEARMLMKGRGAKGLGAWFFLVLLTVLTVWTLGDYLTVSAVDPHDFIRTDSHMIEVRMERGSELEVTSSTMTKTVWEYIDHYMGLGDDMILVPHVAAAPELSTQVFLQLDQQTIELSRFSYVPAEVLEESSLILGRMPESVNEVVVDRWVLDAALREDGILQNSISDISFFLDRELRFPKKTAAVTIVGISDSGEAALYTDQSILASIGVNGSAMMTLSDLQQLYPGAYDHITLADDECLTIIRNGVSKGKPGRSYTFSATRSYTVVEELDIESYATIVVADSQLEPILREMTYKRFHLYCTDKEAVKALLAQPLPEELAGKLQVDVVDDYTDSWEAYTRASQLRADARTIVTVTVMALCAVMLYLLRRSQVHGRLELLAVYRLLGIPGGKLGYIFLLESVLSWLLSAAPAAAATYMAVKVLTGVEDLAFAMVLPWQAAALAALGILGYHLLVSLLPLWRLLRLPPAALAAKYDL